MLERQSESERRRRLYVVWIRMRPNAPFIVYLRLGEEDSKLGEEVTTSIAEPSSIIKFLKSIILSPS